MAEAKIEIVLSNGSKAGETLKELSKQANTLNKEIKDLKPGTAEFISKAKDLEAVNSKMGDIKTQIKGTTEASNQLKQAWNKLPGSQYFNQIGESFGMLKKGVGGLTTQFGSLKTAIAATGIGALVLIISSLVAWFKKTDEGATKLDGIFRSIGATVDVLLNRIINLKTTVTQLFSNPKAFFQGLISDVKEAVAVGQELANTFDDLDQKRRDTELLDKQQSNRIEELLLQSKNVTLSYADRIKLLDQADSLELENYKAKLSYATEYAAAVDKETAQMQKSGTITDEQLDKQNEARIALLNVQSENIAVDEKINNRRSQLSEKQTADNEKRVAAAKKQADDLAKDNAAKLEEQKKAWEDYYAALNTLQEQQINIKSASREKDLELLNFSLQKQIESIDSNAPLYAERMAASAEMARQKRKEINDKWDAQENADAIAKLELDLSTDQNDLNERLLAKQITEQQFAEQSSQNALAFQSSRLELIRQAHGAESAEYQRAYSEYLTLQQSQADAAVAIKKQEMNDQIAAMQGSLGAFGNFFGALAGMQKQGTAQWKAFATAAAIMSAIQGAVNAYTSTAAIPIVGGVLAPIAAGLALAAGYANVKKIQQTKVETPVKKELGGPLYGPSHKDGGIPIEAEGGEFIFSRKATAALGVGNLMRINDYHTQRTRRFVNGGPVTPITNRAPIPRSAAIGSASMSDARPAWVDDFISAQDRRMDRLKVENVATETQSVAKKVDNIIADADV